VQILVDTNILFRGIHQSHPQHRQTREVIAELVQRGDVLCVTAQNLIEFWAVCTRPVEANGLGLLPAQASRILSRIKRSVLRFADDTEAVCEAWKKLVAENGVSGKKCHDARLVSAVNVKCPFGKPA